MTSNLVQINRFIDMQLYFTAINFGSNHCGSSLNLDILKYGVSNCGYGLILLDFDTRPLHATYIHTMLTLVIINDLHRRGLVGQSCWFLMCAICQCLYQMAMFVK